VSSSRVARKGSLRDCCAIAGTPLLAATQGPPPAGTHMQAVHARTHTDGRHILHTDSTASTGFPTHAPPTTASVPVAPTAHTCSHVSPTNTSAERLVLSLHRRRGREGETAARPQRTKTQRASQLEAAAWVERSTRPETPRSTEKQGRWLARQRDGRDSNRNSCLLAA